MKSSTKISSPEELGQYLFKERKHLKLTQKEISEFADVGRKFIIELEKGKATAQLGKVFELRPLHNFDERNSQARNINYKLVKKTSKI